MKICEKVVSEIYGKVFNSRIFDDEINAVLGKYGLGIMKSIDGHIYSCFDLRKVIYRSKNKYYVCDSLTIPFSFKICENDGFKKMLKEDAFIKAEENHSCFPYWLSQRYTDLDYLYHLPNNVIGENFWFMLFPETMEVIDISSLSESTIGYIRSDVSLSMNRREISDAVDRFFVLNANFTWKKVTSTLKHVERLKTKTTTFKMDKYNNCETTLFFFTSEVVACIRDCKSNRILVFGFIVEDLLDEF